VPLGEIVPPSSGMGDERPIGAKPQIAKLPWGAHGEELLDAPDPAAGVATIERRLATLEELAKGSVRLASVVSLPKGKGGDEKSQDQGNVHG
jgi:hypothetical protein